MKARAEREKAAKPPIEFLHNARSAEAMMFNANRQRVDAEKNNVRTTPMMHIGAVGMLTIFQSVVQLPKPKFKRTRLRVCLVMSYWTGFTSALMNTLTGL